MDVGVLAVRYAKALLGYAREEGVAGEVYLQAKSLLDCFAQNPTLTTTLEDPLLSRQEKLELLSSALTGEEKTRDVMRKFFALVLEKHREAFLSSSLVNYQDLYRKSEGIAVVKIITELPRAEEMEDKILACVYGMLCEKMELKKSVDPSIEGGFIFDIDDYRLDASVAAQLRKIRRSLIDKNRRIV